MLIVRDCGYILTEILLVLNTNQSINQKNAHWLNAYNMKPVKNFLKDQQHAHLPSAEGFYPQNRPCTPKIVGTFYMQGYKVKEKTAIVPPVSKLIYL
jgi:hypothetical protein